MPAGVEFHLSRVASGWLTGALTAADSRVPVRASWLADTPRQLVHAAGVVLAGAEARVVWVEEPDAKIWTLSPDGTQVRLMVEGCAGLGPLEDGSFELTSEETYWLPRRGLALGVLAAFDALAVDMSAQDYESQWRHPWPAAELRELRRALGNPRRGHLQAD